ncbi:CPBP family intramembrane glutamic endopeptidase [Arcanobacterium pinnipediorum]|uniref:CPBP family intramembrane metalloprotease n=1 Tax=Arcanobacterium pinnipediorum TaxID=1503041 RepID=A0ABY5AG45_9ACTO|nr:type II CAAX endopeptidase family protein [Arcanobacterium pinnipediorum]USR79179.1 CPBP family intramembrane metalloprotease [Arcanobacterium pinnipediorum]
MTKRLSVRKLPKHILAVFLLSTLTYSIALAGLQLLLSVDLNYIAFPQLGPALGLATAWYFYRESLTNYLLLAPASKGFFRRRFLLVAALCLAYLGFACILAVRHEVVNFAAVFTDWALVGFLTVQFLGAFLEEIGWRGFLQPLFVQRFGTIAGAVYVGIIWASWHGHMLLNPLVFVLFAATCIAISLGLEMVTGGSWWQRAILAAMIHWIVNVTPLLVIDIGDRVLADMGVAIAVLLPQFTLAVIAIVVLLVKRSPKHLDKLALR